MRRRAFAMLIALGLVALSTGCRGVERRFVVESNPPGAMVYINNEPYGPTPVDIPFLYYGTYDVLLVKDGYQTKNVRQKVSPPWYEYPGIDFFAEVVSPIQLTDIRPLFYELEANQPPNLDQLKVDADELRQRSKGLPAPKYPDLGQKPKKGPPPPSGPNVIPPPPRELEPPLEKVVSPPPPLPELPPG